MKDAHERELEATLENIDHLEHFQESLDEDQVSLESGGSQIDYLNVRRLNEIESQLGMEAFSFQDVKDMFGAIGRTSMALGRGFMKALDTIHRWVDQTHLVRLGQLRDKLKAIPADAGNADKGQMERAQLAKSLAINGDIPTSFPTYADAMVELSRRVSNSVVPDLASMSRQVAQRLEAKRWMGMEAFNAEVLEIVKIIGAYKLPMDRYTEQDFIRLFPGNRSIFSNVKPNRPRREPPIETAASKKVIEGVSATNVGIRKRADAVSGRSPNILPVLTGAQCAEMLNAAEVMLKEAVRVAQVSKAYAKDRLPSTSSMVLSGLFHGVKRQVDDVFTSQDDGFDVIEGSHQGGKTTRHKPGKRTVLGGVGRAAASAGFGVEAEKDLEAEHEKRTQMAVWVSRYLKLSLIDHQKTSQAIVLLLVGVARSYLDYVEESLNYHT